MEQSIQIYCQELYLVNPHVIQQRATADKDQDLPSAFTSAASIDERHALWLSLPTKVSNKARKKGAKPVSFRSLPSRYWKPRSRRWFTRQSPVFSSPALTSDKSFFFSATLHISLFFWSYTLVSRTWDRLWSNVQYINYKMSPCNVHEQNCHHPVWTKWFGAAFGCIVGIIVVGVVIYTCAHSGKREIPANPDVPLSRPYGDATARNEAPAHPWSSHCRLVREWPWGIVDSLHEAGHFANMLLSCLQPINGHSPKFCGDCGCESAAGTPSHRRRPRHS